jgi:ABC-2 type transport system ATP-binding protein
LPVRRGPTSTGVLYSHIFRQEPPMTDEMIRAEKLTKNYGNFAAITDVSFTVKAGKVAAFLGPNGAGKSTTMKILTGYLTATSGRAWIAGLDTAEQRIEVARKVGYLPENGPLYMDMTPLGMLKFFAEARGLKGAGARESVDTAIESCGLQSVRNKRIDKLSRGFRQRTCLAQALLVKPEVLILDEPTSGLDPNQTRSVRDTLRGLGGRTTVLLSTHLMQEVKAMADQVLVIHQGRLVFDGAPDAFEKGAGGMEEAFHLLTRKKEAATA